MNLFATGWPWYVCGPLIFSSIAQASAAMAHQASQNPTDIGNAALAYTIGSNVFAHNPVMFIAGLILLATTGAVYELWPERAPALGRVAIAVAGVPAAGEPPPR